MKPILVIQMQRMGDLILTFPLLLWLKRQYSGHPILVVAEPHVASQLAPLAPEVGLVSFADHAMLMQQDYALVVNLSHRRESAWLAGSVRADEKIGPLLDQHQNMYIIGKWQLYRAALVNNNRHNMFHWADLNALDVIPLKEMGGTSWPSPRQMSADNTMIGIFLGASQEEKRPPVAFWFALVRELVLRGLRPVLLGGPAERKIAQEVVSGGNVPVLDLCGTMDLQQFARMGQTLHLMITPDTGPMHLAAWSGLRTLNLSMGPVNPWETGPYQPGHLVLRTTMSCSGCWSCRFDKPACTAVFDARKVALCAHEIVRGREKNLEKLSFSGLEMMVSSRRDGLHAFVPFQRGISGASCRYALDDFWRLFWGHHFGLWNSDRVSMAVYSLQEEHPRVICHLRRSASSLRHEIKALCLRNIPSSSFRATCPPDLRPLAGYIQLVLANGDFSTCAKGEALILASEFLSLLS